jgi:hypothetical protein
LPFIALLTNAPAAVFNLPRRGWFMSADNNADWLSHGLTVRSADGALSLQFRTKINKPPAW